MTRVTDERDPEWLVVLHRNGHVSYVGQRVRSLVELAEFELIARLVNSDHGRMHVVVKPASQINATEKAWLEQRSKAASSSP